MAKEGQRGSDLRASTQAVGGPTGVSFSQRGAMLYKPKPGSVDLWIFGGTDVEGTEGRPEVTPDQLRAHNTRPPGEVGRPASTDKAPALPPDADTDPAPGQPKTTSANPKPKPKPTKPKPSTSPSPTPSPATSAVAAPRSVPTVVDARHDAGSLTPVVADATLVLLIGGAAVFVARRRRRTE
ncbi:hypothetical protein ACWD25_43090 [Streptomyces sp. NPDC002920]